MTGTGRDIVAVSPPVRGVRSRVARQNGRASRSSFGTWFWEIDRVLLLGILFLMGIGLVAVAAASPATAYRYAQRGQHISDMYYFWRQVGWACVSLAVLLGVSALPVTLARRMALVGAAVFLFLVALAPLIGTEVNGAQRWIGAGAFKFQPSEFLKPLFIVTIAWILSFRAKDPGLPVLLITGGLTMLVGALLMLQRDFGQTLIFASVWLILLIAAGYSMAWIGGLIGAALMFVVGAYIFYDTARIRINSFLFPDPSKAFSDHYQTMMARATITAGGATGTGPGEGRMKFNLPEAHTDYIFSVVGEEFGLIACAAIALLYLGIVVWVFIKLLDEEDPFRLLASAGLVAQFGLQALINMAVNTGLVPSKGMTLPFISYGGSSMIALSLGMGLLLAFTRRNPYLTRSPYSVRGSAAL